MHHLNVERIYLIERTDWYFVHSKGMLNDSVKPGRCRWKSKIASIKWIIVRNIKRNQWTLPRSTNVIGTTQKYRIDTSLEIANTDPYRGTDRTGSSVRFIFKLRASVGTLLTVISCRLRMVTPAKRRLFYSKQLPAIVEPDWKSRIPRINEDHELATYVLHKDINRKVASFILPMSFSEHRNLQITWNL